MHVSYSHVALPVATSARSLSRRARRSLCSALLCAAHPQPLSVPCVKPPSTDERSSILPPSHPVSYSLSYFSEELHLCVPQVFLLALLHASCAHALCCSLAHGAMPLSYNRLSCISQSTRRQPMFPTTPRARATLLSLPCIRSIECRKQMYGKIARHCTQKKRGEGGRARRTDKEGTGRGADK